MKDMIKLKVEELPNECYGKNDMTGEIIIIKKYVNGYYPTNYGQVENAEEIINELNEKLGVTYEQRKAMEMRSVFGNWKD